MSLNKVMVIGHVGHDPEIRYTPAGMPVVNLSVATDEAYLNRHGKREERVEWHRVVVVGKLALNCHEHLRKGREVFVEGRLRTAQSKSNGVRSWYTNIVASRVQFLGSPPSPQIKIQDGEDPTTVVDPDPAS